MRPAPVREDDAADTVFAGGGAGGFLLPSPSDISPHPPCFPVYKLLCANEASLSSPWNTPLVVQSAPRKALDGVRPQRKDRVHATPARGGPGSMGPPSSLRVVGGREEGVHPLTQAPLIAWGVSACYICHGGRGMLTQGRGGG